MNVYVFILFISISKISIKEYSILNLNIQSIIDLISKTFIFLFIFIIASSF
jgi:hypothetical protein